MNTSGFDIVVIGSGVIGHSIAFRLKQDAPQLKIAVLGDPVNSLQASRAAAGMLSPFCECDRADRFFDFCRESLNKFPEFLKELASISEASVHFSFEGSLMPSSSYQETWEERKAFFVSEGVPHEIWSAEKVRQKAPYLSEDCGEVMWVGEGQVNNRQMHDALMRASKNLGIRFWKRTFLVLSARVRPLHRRLRILETLTGSSLFWLQGVGPRSWPACWRFRYL